MRSVFRSTPVSSAPDSSSWEPLLTFAIATAEPQKHLCGGGHLLGKLFVMLVVCTRRRETNHAPLILSATPPHNQSFPFTRVQRQVKIKIGSHHRELQVHHPVQQPTSRRTKKPLEHVLAAVDAMEWVASRAVADVLRSTTVFPRRRNSHWLRPVALLLLLPRSEEHPRQRV